MAHAQADGRGGAGARTAAIRAEARGGRRRLPSTLHPDGREHGQASLLSTETSQTAGPSLPQRPQVPQPSQARDLPATSSLVLIGHLQFLFIDPRIQLREDMLMVRPETCSPQRLRRLLDPPAQPALLLHHQGM